MMIDIPENSYKSNLRKEGYTVKNGDFFRIGIPFTLAAIIPAYLYFWFVF